MKDTGEEEGREGTERDDDEADADEVETEEDGEGVTRFDG